MKPKRISKHLRHQLAGGIAPEKNGSGVVVGYRRFYQRIGFRRQDIGHLAEFSRTWQLGGLKNDDELMIPDAAAVRREPTRRHFEVCQFLRNTDHCALCIYQPVSGTDSAQVNARGRNRRIRSKAARQFTNGSLPLVSVDIKRG